MLKKIIHSSGRGPEGFESDSKDIFNLQSGVYKLSVKSKLQCERQFEYEVRAPISSEIFNDAIVNDISCSQDTDGDYNFRSIWWY